MVVRSELPPHARRIPLISPRAEVLVGTTSACAENTAAERRQESKERNYLRMRGEYTSEPGQKLSRSELPPHARRIHLRPPYVANLGGTTSACAENTFSANFPAQKGRNYLRMRGEYILPGNYSVILMELPPHARRILERVSGEFSLAGTTSACAENTARSLFIGIE